MAGRLKFTLPVVSVSNIRAITGAFLVWFRAVDNDVVGVDDGGDGDGVALGLPLWAYGLRTLRFLGG